MSKYYQALSKIQTQYNEKLQKEAKEKEASVFNNPVNDKLKSYSNLEKTRDTLVMLRPLLIIGGILILGLVFYVGVRQGMMIKKSLPAERAETAPAAALPVETARPVPAEPPAARAVTAPVAAAETLEPDVPETFYAEPETETRAASEPAPAAAAPEPAAASEEETGGRPKGKYTLQLVTYSDKSQAEAEVERLKKKGYHAFIIPSGRYNQICINGFEKAADGRAFQGELKQKGELGRYPGSYVREIPPV